MVALVLGAVATAAGFGSLLLGEADVTIVVAREDIPAHAALDPTMVETRTLPADAVHEDALGAVEGVRGRYSEREIPRGTAVLAGDLVEPGSTVAGLPWALAGDERAVAVPSAPDRAVGGTLRPGHRVDVIHFSEADMHGGAMARTLLQDVRVEDVRGGAGDRWSEGKGTPPDTAILAVAPREAEVLSYAMATGTLYLVTGPYHPDPAPLGEGVGSGNLYEYLGGEEIRWTPPDAQ